MNIKTLSILLGLLVLGCGDGGSPFVPEAYGTWLKFEPEGAVCANGTQYKYFINFSETSENLVVFFEGGGACWEYGDCSNARPFNTECIKEAPGTTCIRDDYATSFIHFDIPSEFNDIAAQLGVIDGNVPIDLAYPVLSSNPDISPMADWNKVFVAYCTGDVYIGNTVRTYTDPTGDGPDVEFHHKGHENTLRIIDDLSQKFRDIPQMLVGGCSAGGVGSLNNYAFIREGLPGVGRSYLLADSGPIIPSKLPNGEDSHSGALYETIREAWDIDSVIDSLPFGGERVSADYGDVNALLAETYPDDRLSISVFSRDYNFPLNSYVGFSDFLDDNGTETAAGRTEVYRLFTEDLEALRAQFDEHENLGYYIPFYRNTNSSHCLTVAGFEDFDGETETDRIAAFALAYLQDANAVWKGTEIESASMNLRGYIEQLLDDDEPLQSHFEEACEGRYEVCSLECEAYDELLCEDAVD